MKILHVGTFPFPSPQGSQVYVQGILRGLVEQGHQVSLLCYGHGIGEVPSGIRVIRTPNIPFYQNMRAGPDWIKPLLDVLMIPLLRREKPDIIHVHNYEAPLVAKVADLCRRETIPMVYSAHNNGGRTPTYFSGKNRRRVIARFGRFLDRSIPQIAQHCVVLSETGRENLERLGCKSISLIYPGVSISEFEDILPQELPEGSWVIYAGNPDRYQDLEILMEAMKFLPDVGLIMVSASKQTIGLEKKEDKSYISEQIITRRFAAIYNRLTLACCQGCLWFSD